MATERDARRRACIDKTAAEVDSLEARGVCLSGNAFSQILLAKGELNQDELAGAEPLSGADGRALKASLSALGYAPEDWETLLTCTATGESLDAELVREAVVALDPATLVCCDESAADAVRDAWADELAALDTLDEALLTPGLVVHISGMRVLNLGGFEAALSDPHQKQIMWARLKKIPPLGEPY